MAESISGSLPLSSLKISFFFLLPDSYFFMPIGFFLKRRSSLNVFLDIMVSSTCVILVVYRGLAFEGPNKEFSSSYSCYFSSYYGVGLKGSRKGSNYFGKEFLKDER